MPCGQAHSHGLQLLQGSNECASRVEPVEGGADQAGGRRRTQSKKADPGQVNKGRQAELTW